MPVLLQQLEHINRLAKKQEKKAENFKNICTQMRGIHTNIVPFITSVDSVPLSRLSSYMYACACVCAVYFLYYLLYNHVRIVLVYIFIDTD